MCLEQFLRACLRQQEQRENDNHESHHAGCCVIRAAGSITDRVFPRIDSLSRFKLATAFQAGDEDFAASDHSGGDAPATFFGVDLGRAAVGAQDFIIWHVDNSQ